MKKLLALICLLGCVLFTEAKVYNVRDYGAKGNGRNLDSPAINRAIEKAAANGGGEIFLPAGNYLCGSIRLKSNINLHLSAGCIITAAPAEMKAYDESESFGGFPEYQDGGHTYFHNSLIWAEGQENVSITGHGMIDGIGLTKKDTERAGNLQGGSIGTGDKAIALKLCKNITIRDITIYRGGHFAIIVTGCDRGTIDNVTIDTNRDGIDIDCCKFVSVSNCKVNTPGDDAIVLKSSYALKRPVVCENISVANCHVTGYKLGSFLDGTYVPEKVNWVCGRFKLGTESNGGYRNITLSNCTFIHSSGLAFECVDRGVMENISVANVTMNHVHHYPIYITTGCRNRGPEDLTNNSTANNIHISDVSALDCDSLCSIIVTGLPREPIKNISLSNIHLQFQGGGAKDLVNKDYREQGKNYPEPKFAGQTPAYCLYARHVDGLYVNNITASCINTDYRPVVVLDDVTNAKIGEISAPVADGVDKIVTFNSSDIKIENTGGNKLIANGVSWFDDRGMPVNAHGACLLQENGIYWLFGEYKTDSINNFNGFACYSSPDLVNWKFEKIALPVQNGNEADGVMLGKGSIGERPKVMRSPTTGKYVMLAHTDNAYYKNPAIGVAVTDSINGDYRLLGAVEYQGKPIKKWDMGTFVDDDGKSYLLIHHGPIYRLSDDLLHAEEMVADVKGLGESPAMFKKDGIYYLLSSHTTSWERNDNFYFTAPSISGPWTRRGTFAPEGSLTFNSQTTYVFPLSATRPDGSAETLPMYMGDRWSFPIQSSAASYVWLPMEASDSVLSIPKYMEFWNPMTMKAEQLPGKKQAAQWKSNVTGESFVYDFKGKRISIEGTSSPHGGYGLVEIFDNAGAKVLEKHTDFYSKVPYDGLLFRSPELENGTYRLKVTVSGLRSEWFNKRKDRFGTDGTDITITNLIIE